jgi:hypothetical protein
MTLSFATIRFFAVMRQTLNRDGHDSRRGGGMMTALELLEAWLKEPEGERLEPRNATLPCLAQSLGRGRKGLVLTTPEMS